MGKREEVKKDRVTRVSNNYKHGHRYSKEGKTTTEYQIWAGLLKRCLNPNCNIYAHYGGRGIDFDPRWRDFRLFLEDVGLRPSKDYSLDRINNDRGYWKDNIRWATRAEQSRNKKSNILVDGLCLKDWCLDKGFHYKTVWRWVARENKSLDFVIHRGQELWARES